MHVGVAYDRLWVEVVQRRLNLSLHPIGYIWHGFLPFLCLRFTGLRSEDTLVTFVIYWQYVSLLTVIYDLFVVLVLLPGQVSAAKF